MVDVTLLEVHVDDANATFSTGGSDDEAEETETEVVAGEPADDAGGSGLPLARALVGLVFAVAVAVAVRKLVLGGDGSADL